VYGTLIEQHGFEASGKDSTRLGRWVSITLRGGNGVKTRLMYGYNLCASSRKAIRSSHQQQRQYLIRKEKDRLYPRTRFKNDLLAQLSK
jgi:hypothetical protein